MRMTKIKKLSENIGILLVVLGVIVALLNQVLKVKFPVENLPTIMLTVAFVSIIIGFFGTKISLFMSGTWKRRGILMHKLGDKIKVKNQNLRGEYRLLEEIDEEMLKQEERTNRRISYVKTNPPKIFELKGDQMIFFLNPREEAGRLIQEMIDAADKIIEKHNLIVKEAEENSKFSEDEKRIMEKIVQLDDAAVNETERARSFHRLSQLIAIETLEEQLRNISEKDKNLFRLCFENNKEIGKIISELAVILEDTKTMVVNEKYFLEEIKNVKKDSAGKYIEIIQRNLENAKIKINEAKTTADRNENRIRNLLKEIISLKEKIIAEFDKQKEEEEQEIMSDEKLELMINESANTLYTEEIDPTSLPRPKNAQEQFELMAKIVKARDESAIKNMSDFVKALNEGALRGKFNAEMKRKIIAFIGGITGGEELARIVENRVNNYTNEGLAQLRKIVFEYFKVKI